MFVILFDLLLVRFAFLLVFVTSAFFAMNVNAAPLGGNVTNGTAVISTQNTTTNITQETESLIIDWNSFNLDSDEVVNFDQPSSSSIVLNNILQNDASVINGTITANGKVILINPRGLIFGGEAHIDTGDLIVSSLSMVKEEFLNGEFAFSDINENQGVIINHGTILAASGVTFIGESIVNNGFITAELGYINLVAGKQAVLTFDDQGFMGVKVDEDVINNELGLENAIENNGELMAAGRVAISARVTSQLFDKAINNSGVVKATGFNITSLTDTPNIHLESNGNIENSGTLNASDLAVPNDLQAGRIIIAGKEVIHSGLLDVSSTSGRGGYIELLGEQVGMTESGIINASGDQSGGTVIIGSSRDQSIGAINAEAVYIGENTQITANAGIAGSGGEIVIGSENTTRYFGNIETKGGSLSGNGGSVDISAKEQLVFNGTVNSMSAVGEVGELMLETHSLAVIADEASSVVDGGMDFSEASESNLSTSTVKRLLDTSAVKFSATNNISFDSAIESDSVNSLKIVSANTIDIHSAINIAGLLRLEAGIINLSGLSGIDASTIEISASQFVGSSAINIVETLNISDVDDMTEFNGLVTAIGPSALLIANNNNSVDLVSNLNAFNVLSTEFVNFKVVDIAGGTLNGTAIDGLYSFKGSQSVEVNNIQFNQITSVVGSEGIDQVLGLENQQWLLSDTNNDVTTGGIFFTNIDNASNGHIVGTSGRDEFMIIGAQSVTTKGITFDGILSIDAGDLIDTVSGASTWAITSTGVESSGIDIINAEIVNSLDQGSLLGTNEDDFFVIEGTKSVAVKGMTFTNIAFVDAGEGSDDIQYDSGTWNVQSESSMVLRGIDFSSIESTNINNSDGVTERTLTGTETDDVFKLVAENTVSSNGITFYGIGSVDARGGEDTVEQGDSWQLFDAGFESLGIDFFHVERVNSNPQGLLVGTASSDTFQLVSGMNNETNVVINNEIIFTNIDQVNGGENGGEGDLVTSDSAEEWQLNTDGTFSSDQLIFTAIERTISTASTVLGSAEQDVFETTNITNTIIANDVYFENVSIFDGGGSDDQLIINTNYSVNIIDQGITDGFSQSADQFTSQVTFKNIELLDIKTSGDVNLSSGFDVLNVEAENLTVATRESVTIDAFNVKDTFSIETEDALTFLNNVEFNSQRVKLSAQSIEFMGSLKVVSNDFILDAGQLIVEGGIDVDVNVERSVPADVGEDISLSIFNEINMFLASEGSIRIQDSVDSEDGFKWLISDVD